MASTRATSIVWLGLAVAALALWMRALGFEWVFPDADTVVFSPGDAQYHVRRSLYAWTHFPFVLFFDPYINFPGGASISWPPLFDFTVAGAGRALAGDPVSFQVMAAWAPVLIGTLTLLPVYAVGRRLGGPGLGLGAAALLAILPMSVTYSRVGQLDHHVAVAAIGACLLAVCARLVSEERASTASGVGLALGRIAMLLMWHGSLLYLALVELTLWTCAAVTGRRDLYAVQAASAIATLIVVAPLVWLFPEPLGGAYSAIALSRLHVVVISIVVLVSAGLWLCAGRETGRSVVRRLAWTVALALAALGVVLLLPGPRAGIEPALRFLTMRDGVGLRTGEQLPLFAMFGRETGRPVWEVWGLLGYAIPLLPFAIAWAAPRARRAPAFVVAGWCGWFGALAVVQRRYGNDLGPAVAVGTALVVAELGRRASARWGGGKLGAAVAVALGLLLLAPPLVFRALPQTVGTLRALGDATHAGDRALSTVAGSLTRFLEQVRAATPETSGYFDVAQEPEYGIVAHANFGHAIQNVAHRPTPTDPFWAFIGRENWNAAFGLLDAKSEGRAVELALRLRTRYVMTHSSADPGTLEGWLHHTDGRRAGPWSESQHFRLVTEGPKGGVHFARSFQVSGRRITGSTPPYKLFEVVEGAVLEVPAAPGEVVVATLQLRTLTGRDFMYQARGNSGSDGIARLRVPYPSRPPAAAGVAASGPYRVEVGGQLLAVAVSESDVRTGSVVSVAPTP